MKLGAKNLYIVSDSGKMILKCELTDQGIESMAYSSIESLGAVKEGNK